MSDNAPLLTVMILLEELKEVDNWFMLGAYLSVPVRELNKIQSTYTQDGVERCKLQMLQYWLDNTVSASWRDIARALEQLNMLTLAARLKSKYLWISPANAQESPSSPQPCDTEHSTHFSTSTNPPTNPSTHSSTDPCTHPSADPLIADLVADVKVVGSLQDLESDFTSMMMDIRKDLADCNIGDIVFYLEDLFGVKKFRKCQNIDEVLRKLRRDRIDTFNIRYLERLVREFHQSDAIIETIEKYEKKKEEFLNTTTVKEFQQAVVSRAEIVLPRGMAVVTIKIPKEYGIPRTMKDVEELAKKAFKGLHKNFVRINVTPGSIIITWYVPEDLCEELVKLARESIAVLREEGVEEVSVMGEKSVTLSTQIGHEVNIPEITEQEHAVVKKVYGEFYHQLVDLLSDGDTHCSIVTHLHKKSVISEKVLAAQMTLIAQERGRSLLKVLGLEEKPHKLRELITVMMEEKKVKSLAEEMSAQLSKYEHDESADTTDLLDRNTQYQRLFEQHEEVMADLKYKLDNIEEELKTANKLLSMKERLISSLLSQEYRKETELKEMRRRVGDLEEFVLSQFPSSLVQVTGEGKELATYGKETSFELNLSSHTASSIPFPIKHLSCQLTDPHHQHMHCSITSTQPGVCTVKYTPTVRGPHQLRITIRDTDIPGSPFTLHVLPSPEMRGVITGINRPYGVAVSKNGEVVVSEYDSHCISVYSRVGDKIRSFGSQGSSRGQFQYPRSVAITSDNHILIADTNNNRIQMFTMEGRFKKSVGQEGQEPLQFNHPSGIAVHPSGRAFVADSWNHRIQVLNQHLTYSDMFGSKGSAPGKFKYPSDVAISSSGVVYVTDDDNHRVQLFSEDGQFISSFGSKGSQHGQLFNPSGICVDSSNTVYVTDLNHRVSVYTSSGQFISSFGTQGSGVGQLSYPKGVAVDNTTGALYVCDLWNDRVVA